MRVMKLPLFWVDAFADRLFHGNPAAVVPLDRWLPHETMQRIALEHGIAEDLRLSRHSHGGGGSPRAEAKKAIVNCN